MNTLPAVYGITATALFPDVSTFLHRLKQVLQSGKLQLLQVREKRLTGPERKQFAKACVGLCHAHNCKVLLNDDDAMAHTIGADGIHLSSTALQTYRRTRYHGLVGVSCHNQAELDTGFGHLGADFAVLSPVSKTLTHVNATPLGWQGFANLAMRYEQPVYALGGLTLTDVTCAQHHGAVGIASMRDIWGLAPRTDA